MPVTIEGRVCAIYPAEITQPEPAFKAGQVVPNWYGTPHVIGGVRFDVKWSEAWEPTGPGEDDGKPHRVIDPTEWEYLLVRINNKDRVTEWGWVKETELKKDISDREWKVGA